MFEITRQDLETVLHDFGFEETIQAAEELRRYRYEAYDPASREVRLIVKAVLTGRSLVIRFRNEHDVNADLLEAQGRFAGLLKEKGIAVPEQYQSEGRYAKVYEINGYEVLVNVEAFMANEIRAVDADIAAKAGILLARMHTIAEAADFHVDNRVLFDPLADNDLFEPASFFCHEELLRAADEDRYTKIRKLYERYLAEIRRVQEPGYAVQGDFSNNNLFLADHGDIGVFDFNRCGDSCLFFDAVMQGIYTARLMDYPGHLATHAEEIILPAFLKGYHSVRPFTEKQQEAYPFLHALATAFWRMDLRWADHSLAKAAEKADQKALRQWSDIIYRRLLDLAAMPV